MSCPGAIVAANRRIGRQRDRYRPEDALGRAHHIADALPVGVRHEAANGVNPPMPSMMMSPFSRELTRSCGRRRRARELGHAVLRLRAAGGAMRSRREG